MKWKRLRIDIEERFLDGETAKGLLAILVAWHAFHLDNDAQAFTFLLHMGELYLVYEGLRKIFVNRIKQAAKRERLIQRRKVHDASPNA